MWCKDVAAHFNFDRKTIGRLGIKYNWTGDVVHLPRPGVKGICDVTDSGESKTPTSSCLKDDC